MGKKHLKKNYSQKTREEIELERESKTTMDEYHRPDPPHGLVSLGASLFSIFTGLAGRKPYDI